MKICIKLASDFLERNPSSRVAWNVFYKKLGKSNNMEKLDPAWQEVKQASSLRDAKNIQLAGGILTTSF